LVIAKMLVARLGETAGVMPVAPVDPMSATARGLVARSAQTMPSARMHPVWGMLRSEPSVTRLIKRNWLCASLPHKRMVKH
jgi:hypothetical protein